MISFVFLGVSIICFYILGHRISLKIPQLAAISDEVITARFEEDSAKLRLLLLNFKSFYREGKFKIFFWSFSAKIVRRLHIALLRLDNGAVTLLERIKVRVGETNAGKGDIPVLDEPVFPVASAQEIKKVIPAGPQKIREIRVRK